jgi:hypothetical protein
MVIKFAFVSSDDVPFWVRVILCFQFDMTNDVMNDDSKM